jgi:periplasmic divalent cation tolerance protein
MCSSSKGHRTYRAVHLLNCEVEIEDEWMIVIKTTATRFAELVAHIKANHSYETPEITATPITDGNPDYLEWISTEVRGR